MSPKDDPVQNVTFVQLVESHPCLWNSDLSTYSKKDEIHKAWHDVAAKTNDSARNCRERWRTIRSSFQRSLKMSHTTTGRHKRKYYLSKYLQFLLPYTKSRSKAAPTGGTVQRQHQTPATTQISVRKASTMTSQPPPLSLMTRSSAAMLLVAPPQVATNQPRQVAPSSTSQPPMTTVNMMPGLYTQNTSVNACDDSKDSEGTNNEDPVQMAESAAGLTVIKTERNSECPQLNGTSLTLSNAERTVPLSDFSEWIKQRNQQNSQNNNQSNNNKMSLASSDGDQYFLNSLLQFMGEMTAQQNRRFRQKAMALINEVLDNKD